MYRPSATAPVSTKNNAMLTKRRYRKKLACMRLCRSWLTRFRFGAFFQCGFPRKFYAPFIVDADALDPNDVTGFHDVLRAFDAEIRQFGDVHESFLARENFHKRAEFFRGDNAPLIGLADLDFACHTADDFLRARHALTAGRVNVHGAVVLNVNFCAGLSDDTFNGFAARPDKRTDFLGINFDRL